MRCARARVCVCVRACVCMCVCACVRTDARACVCVLTGAHVGQVLYLCGERVSSETLPKTEAARLIVTALLQLDHGMLLPLAACKLRASCLQAAAAAVCACACVRVRVCVYVCEYVS